MVGSVSSANPEKLEHYAAIGENLDQELLSQSNPLAAQLEHFEATCTEPGCRTNATGLGAELRSYGRDLFPFDDWVRQIGRRFAWADGLRLGGRGISLGQQTVRTPLSGSERFLLAQILKPPLWLSLMLAILSWVKPEDTSLGRETELGRLVRESTQKGETPLGRLIQEPVSIPRSLEDTRPQEPTPIIRAETVPTFDSSITRYYRHSEKYREESKDYSNCTWYAAAAVKAFSGGIINLGGDQSLGNANEWANNARAAVDDKKHSYHNYIAGVNKTPAVGSIYCHGGHVAFVEEVELMEKNGKKNWVITLSEENYYYDSQGVFSGSEKVDFPNHPEVKRWRRTKTLDDVGGEIAEGDFIHFNYDGS